MGLAGTVLPRLVTGTVLCSVLSSYIIGCQPTVQNNALLLLRIGRNCKKKLSISNCDRDQLQSKTIPLLFIFILCIFGSMQIDFYN